MILNLCTCLGMLGRSLKERSFVSTLARAQSRSGRPTTVYGDLHRFNSATQSCAVNAKARGWGGGSNS